jgi:uncharacterized protein YndB with AHSA1/START domain
MNGCSLSLANARSTVKTDVRAPFDSIVSRSLLVLLGLIGWVTVALAALGAAATSGSGTRLVGLLGPLVDVGWIGALVLVAALVLTWLPIWRPPWAYELSIWCLALGFLIEIAAIWAAAALAAPVAGVLLALPVVAYIAYWVPPAHRRVVAELEEVVGATPAAVFELATDPAAQPLLMPERPRPGEILGGGPLRGGSRVRGWAQVGMVRVVGVDEVVEYDPPSRVAYRTLSGAPANLVVFAFDEVPAGTRVRYRSEALISIASALIGGWRRGEAARRMVEYRSRWISAIRRELSG